MKVEVLVLAVLGLAAADTKVVFPYHLPLLTSASVAQPVASGIDGHPTITQYAAPVPVVKNTATDIRYSVPATQYAIPAAQFAIPAAQFAIPAAQYAIPAAQHAIPASQYTIPAAQYAIPAAQYAIPAAQFAIPATQYVMPAAERSAMGAPAIVARTSMIAPSVINIDDDDDDIEATAYGIMRADNDDDLDSTRYRSLDDDHFEIENDDDRK